MIQTMKMSRDWRPSYRRCASLAIALWALLSAPGAFAEQALFAQAEMAANRFVIAVAQNDDAALRALLGEDYRDLLPVADLDEKDVAAFLDAWTIFHTLLSTDANTRMLAVGEYAWTLPIPIVREAQGAWRFDTHAGMELMRIRRIGRNELSVMQSMLAYHDAQVEYASVDHDGDGVLEYAQRLRSTPGQHDGLYWAHAPGEPQSPLGPLFAEVTPEGAYHGYHYRLLTAGGGQSYLDAEDMVLGFALIAWPAEYGDSGVMSFMLSHEGVLYEADLGADGAALANAMPGFEPGMLWRPVQAEFAEP